MSGFVQRVRDIGLPLDKLIVIGSGILDAYGIRESNDIDLVVHPEVYEQLCADTSWRVGELYGSWAPVCKGSAEVWLNWSLDDQPHPDYDDLLAHSEMIEDVRFITLAYLYQWKAAKGREKDLNDCRLIEAYQRNQNNG